MSISFDTLPIVGYENGEANKRAGLNLVQIKGGVVLAEQPDGHVIFAQRKNPHRLISLDRVFIDAGYRVTTKEAVLLLTMIGTNALSGWRQLDRRGLALAARHGGIRDSCPRIVLVPALRVFSRSR